MEKNKTDKQPDDDLHVEGAQKTFKGKLNEYAFIHLPKTLREAWKIQKDTEQPITIELTTNGALIIRKP